MLSLKTISVIFYCSSTGSEPVRTWLKNLDKADRYIIGEDIKTIEFGWPMGMPICRAIHGYKGLWEVRSRLKSKRIARVIFYIKDGEMILLHGFIKKTQKTDPNDLLLAERRRKDHETQI